MGNGKLSHFRKCTSLCNEKMFTYTNFHHESGRNELWINAILRSIKYWLKIIKMNKSRYVRKVYNMMRHDDSPDNWAGKIKEVLYRYNCVHMGITACC